MFSKMKTKVHSVLLSFFGKQSWILRETAKSQRFEKADILIYLNS